MQIALKPIFFKEYKPFKNGGFGIDSACYNIYMVQVNFYSTLRQIVGKKTVEIALPEGGKIRQLVEEIVSCYPALRREILSEQGDLLGHIHVFINGRESSFLENALETTLYPDDSISIFPAVGGG